MGTHRQKEKLANSSITKWVLPNRIPRDPDNIDEDTWIDVTRRETMEGAESAIDASINHYEKKLAHIRGPQVVKTFK